jgi:hypothetical protein
MHVILKSLSLTQCDYMYVMSLEAIIQSVSFGKLFSIHNFPVIPAAVPNYSFSVTIIKYWISFDEVSAYINGDLLYNRRRCGGVTRSHHDVTFPLLTQYRGKCLTGFIQKKTLSIPRPADFLIWKTDEISRPLRLMHDGISFDKILPKQVGLA